MTPASIGAVLLALLGLLLLVPDGAFVSIRFGGREIAAGPAAGGRIRWRVSTKRGEEVPSVEDGAAAEILHGDARLARAVFGAGRRAPEDGSFPGAR